MLGDVSAYQISVASLVLDSSANIPVRSSETERVDLLLATWLYDRHHRAVTVVEAPATQHVSL